MTRQAEIVSRFGPSEMTVSDTASLAIRSEVHTVLKLSKGKFTSLHAVQKQNNIEQTTASALFKKTLVKKISALDFLNVCIFTARSS